MNSFDNGEVRTPVLIVFSHTNGMDPQPSATATATATAKGRSNLSVDTGVTVRRLTPLECERLMSWPDNHTKYRTNEDGTVTEQADSHRYKQCGNGVGTNVVDFIVKRLIELA